MFQLEFADCSFINHRDLKKSLRNAAIDFFGVCTMRKTKTLVVVFKTEPSDEVKEKATLLTKHWLANHKERVFA